MDAKLLSAFRHLAEAISPHDPASSDRLRRALDEWEEGIRAWGGRPNGILAAFYTCLEDSCRRGDLRRIAEIVGQLPGREEALTNGGDLATSGLQCRPYLKMLDQALRTGELWKPSDEAVTIALPTPDLG